MISYRRANADDVSEIFVIRTSVEENLLTYQELQAYGITPSSVAQSFQGPCSGWIAEENRRAVGFSIANKESSSIFALFVLPSHQGLGIGRKLLALATEWLWLSGASRIWLRTQVGASAITFYSKAGWDDLGPDASGDNLFEIVGKQ